MQDRWTNHRPHTPPLTYRNFTPLNVPQSEVLMQIHNRNYVRWTEKMKSQSNKRNRDTYYEFHKDYDRDTENCFNLLNHIEDLIWCGYLSGFINRTEKSAQEERRVDEAQQPPHRGPPAGVIHVISGRSASEGESSSGGKRYARLCKIDNRGHRRRHDTSITFTGDDLRGVQTPHNDALVITAKVIIASYTSADVLFEDAFEKLGIARDWLAPIITPLMGFLGESLQPTGRITLSFLIGDGDVTMTAMVDFIVVRCPSSYNVILSSSTLNALQVVVSTYHLAMKFPTKYGIGVVRADQKTMQHCYQLSCRGPCPVIETLVAEAYDLCDEVMAHRGQPMEDLVQVPLVE
ncbi:PREDICTED: uncharacterized protein LOC104611899 [Nelumbo nucifera]|uniref:Uncharacterized protein LOC104611899 n=1 Tax=Nelumbo nucifera TaxID=4432 RepID=A0A1U8BKT2_NELNU|nr:PREDICTED: uncharacterized protein LOC104611899 [Nelumbo nucifera]